MYVYLNLTQDGPEEESESLKWFLLRTFYWQIMIEYELNISRSVPITCTLASMRSSLRAKASLMKMSG